MKSTIFWDVMLCSFVDVHSCIGGMYCLQLLGQKIRQGSNQQEAEASILPFFHSSHIKFPFKSYKEYSRLLFMHSAGTVQLFIFRADAGIIIKPLCFYTDKPF
jgi:hypothetical protein